MPLIEDNRRIGAIVEIRIFSPYVPLKEFGLTAAVLNESFLIGAEVAFCRPLCLGDVGNFGLEVILAMEKDYKEQLAAVDLAQASLDGVSIPSGILTFANAVPSTFFEQEGQLFVRFIEPVLVEGGHSITTWLLSDDTTLIFKP